MCKKSRKETHWACESSTQRGTHSTNKHEYKNNDHVQCPMFHVHTAKMKISQSYTHTHNYEKCDVYCVINLYQTLFEFKLRKLALRTFWRFRLRIESSRRRKLTCTYTDWTCYNCVLLDAVLLIYLYHYISVVANFILNKYAFFISFHSISFFV